MCCVRCSLPEKHNRQWPGPWPWECVWLQGMGRRVLIQAWTGGVGSRKLGVPCENVAIIRAAVAGLSTICAPSRTPCTFFTTQTHMNTQKVLTRTHACTRTQKKTVIQWVMMSLCSSHKDIEEFFSFRRNYIRHKEGLQARIWLYLLLCINWDMFLLLYS